MRKKFSTTAVWLTITFAVLLLGCVTPRPAPTAGSASLAEVWHILSNKKFVDLTHTFSPLDELTFRFNRCKSASRGKLFYRLVQQAVAVQPSPYGSLVGGKQNPPEKPQPMGAGGVN